MDVPMHVACSEGDLSVCKELLSAGVPLDDPDDEGDTPLHVACQSGQLPIAKWLVEKGATAEAINNDDDTVLHLAAFNGHADVVDWLLKVLPAGMLDATNNVSSNLVPPTHSPPNMSLSLSLSPPRTSIPLLDHHTE
jgi:ankyrin repeat protein